MIFMISDILYYISFYYIRYPTVYKISKSGNMISLYSKTLYIFIRINA